MDERQLAVLREAYGWDAPQVAPGPHGAVGRVWRVSAGGRRYAVKEIVEDPPAPSRLAAARELAARAAAAGVRSPAAHPDRWGRYLLDVPGAGWLSVHDWVDLRPGRFGPAELGDLLGRLHAAAPAAAAEPEGGPPSPWYDRVPPARAWERAAAGDPWGDRIAAALPVVAALGAAVRPADPARTLLCHRDLHPGNVPAGPDGAPVVVDWDDVGPAEPGRELVGVLFDFLDEGSGVDPAAARQLVGAYRRAGGPGRVTGAADGSMLVASRLNFLLQQVGVLHDPAADPMRRAWAREEVDEGLRLLPTPHRIAAARAVLAAG